MLILACIAFIQHEKDNISNLSTNQLQAETPNGLNHNACVGCMIDRARGLHATENREGKTVKHDDASRSVTEKNLWREYCPCTCEKEGATRSVFPSDILMSMIRTPPSRSEEEELAELTRTIDRSRKRHLSIGLLRGDLVQDRLALQESTASPLLKKAKSGGQSGEAGASPASSPEPYFSPTGTEPGPRRISTAGNPAAGTEMAMTMAEFRAYMDDNTNKSLANANKRLDKVDGNLSSVKATVSQIDNTVRENSKRLDEQMIDIRANKQDILAIKDEIDQIKKGQPKPRVTTPVTSDTRPTATEEENFRKARRSLRLWPIAGRNTDELWTNTGLFLGTKLGMKGKLDQTSIDSVSRVTVPSGPGVVDEALVVFVDNRVRDLVMGAAALLAPCVTADGKPTAGLRIEVPAHLQRNFRILFRFGQTLRSRHGAGTRRHVKFDDLDGTLYLNVRLPGDEAWSKVSVDMARRGIRAREVLSSEALERRLDITGPLQERVRAASASAPNPPANRDFEGASAWTARRSESTSS